MSKINEFKILKDYIWLYYLIFYRKYFIVMRIVFLSLFFVMSVFVVHSQNSSIGARYGFVDYASLNKVVTDAGYTAFDEDTNIQFCFGSAKRKKKTSVGFEIFFGLDNKQQNSNGNVNKLKQAGFLLDTRSALNKSKKSIVSIVFNFGFQRSKLFNKSCLASALS